MIFNFVKQKISLKKILSIGVITLLFATYLYFLFSNLGYRPFINWDEAIYAQVAKESKNKNSWLNFTYFNERWSEKPPLSLLLVEASYKLFGVNEFAGRLPSAVFGFLTIILNFWLTKKIFKHWGSGIFVAASYLLCFHFFFHAYFLQLDTMVGFFIFTALGSFWLAKQNPKYYYVFFTSLALGVLTKNVIGLLPLPIILIYSLLSKQWQFLTDKKFYVSSTLFWLIALPWHIWQTILYGTAFWKTYLFYHVLSRYSSALENNGGNFSFYLPVLNQNTIFASFLTISFFYFFYRAYKKQSEYTFFLVASLFIFIFFSFSKTKGYGYLVVIYPYLLTMIGVTVWDLQHKLPFTWLRFLTLTVLFVIAFIMGAQQNWFKKLRLNNEQSYIANKEVGKFLKNNYPNKPVYKKSYLFADPAVFYYFGKPIPDLPKNTTLPENYTFSPNYRVFHTTNRSVYNFNSFLYIDN